MSSTSEQPLERRAALAEVDPEERAGWGSRLAALAALFAVGGSLLWLLFALVSLFRDAWVAPIELSPDNDQVIQLDLQLTRQRAEMQRIQAEIARFDAEIAAIDAGLDRLASLRRRSDELFSWGAQTQGEEASTLRSALRDLREERVVLERLLARQREEVGRTRANLAGGLVQRRDLEAQEQALDHLELQRIANARALDEVELRSRRARESAVQFQASVRGGSSARGSDGARLPEIIQRQEQETRVEVEILRLEAERRGLIAMRDVGRRSLDELREVMAHIESRPLYRATQSHMDVAFVPYEQLADLEAGARVVRCKAAIFACRDVGRITEILPGEVVTQDPWGEMARGRYAVLELEDPTAVQERILRVRP